MKMLEISKEKFEEFASKSPYNNYCQTDNYGITMTDNGFNYTFIAYTTNNREILAAGMFLTKKIGKRYYYSYCPKGFIIDYNDADLVRRFTTNLKKYYRRKKVIFLKINPEVPIATIDAKKAFEKAKSDKVLEEYKQDVIHATQGLRKNEDTYIAGALVIKHDNKITIIAADKDKNYDYLNPDYFLYNRLLDMYKEEYEIANIGALADDFKDNSQFKEYNQLKIDFNPTIYEYIGELDLIISEWRFKIVEKNNLLSNEFSRKRNIDNLQPTTTTYTEEEQEDYI